MGGYLALNGCSRWKWWNSLKPFPASSISSGVNLPRSISLCGDTQLHTCTYSEVLNFSLLPILSFSPSGRRFLELLLHLSLN